MVDNTTTKDVRDSLKANLNSVETENSDLAGGIRATVSEEEVGAFYGLMRREGFDFSSKRIGSTIVAHIVAEEDEGLGQIFG